MLKSFTWLISFVIFSVAVIPFGSIIVKLNVKVQLFASVTFTEWIPEVKLKTSSVVDELDHK